MNNYGRTFAAMAEATARLLGGAGEKTFDFLADQICHEIQGYALTRRAVSELASLKPLIRCHPSEDPAFWHGLGEIDDRTPFTERLNDARCVVHVSGCGTGLESALAGVPTVRLGGGGHGLSSMIGKGIEKDIRKAVRRGRVPAKPDFAAVTLPDALRALQERHHFDCGYFDLELAYSKITWAPAEFHENKFGADPKKGKMIGWRTALWDRDPR